MSKQIEERVVSMQFDNQRFEKNVSTSMSTLDKLKQKLNLTGASKGLENVQAASKKVDMSGLSNSVETVRTKFSALEVIGVTALANLTNSAVNAGKRMISALTIDPVKDGFSEYEMTLNAVQTTMAATGQTAEEVAKELKKLDEYADKTVYSTADMLNNLPKFTNAGVKLEDATKAMIGIANATALAGGDAGKASIAFYNLGQAIGTGYLTRMDYNSINNAGIATMEWKNQMVDAAVAAGTLTKVGDDLYEAGGKQFTLQQLFIDGLQKQWATTDVMMKVFGDYGDETTEIGKKSYSAAQDIKTFTQMMESLKATAGTGWKDTWQIIFGDLAEAKELWTGLTNFISNVVTKMADVRNAILESALGRGFGKLADKIQGVLNPVKSAVDTAKGALKDYDTLVKEIIAGKWGNAPTRWQDLTKAGYDWAHAQNLVNERLGNSVRHATNYKEAQDGLNKSQEKGAETQGKITKEDAKRLAELIKLSDAQLKAKGYTDEQIKAFRELEKTAKRLGMPIEEFLEKIDEIDGRWLLFEGFANIGRSLTGVFKAMGQAWKEIFESDGTSTIQKIADALFNAIVAFHRFSRSLLVNKENSDKLKRTFKGLFAILDLIMTIVGGPIKIAFKILSQILGAFNINVLDITAIIGDAIVKFHDWVDSVLDFTGVFKWLTPYIQKATKAVKNWVAEAKPLEKIAGFFTALGTAAKKAFAAFKRSEAYETGRNIIAGLWQGIQNGAGTLWKVITNVIRTLITKAKDILGIHSPSVVFAAIGGFIVAGLLLGLTQGFPSVWDTITGFFGKVVSFLQAIDWGAVLAAFTSIGLVLASNKMASAFATFASMFEGVGEFLEGVGIGIKRLFTGIGKYLKAKAWEARSKALLNFAFAIAVLAASVYVLAQLDAKQLRGAIDAIGALTIVLTVLTIAITKMNDVSSLKINKSGLNVAKVTTQIVPIAAALLLVGMAVKQLAGLSVGDITKGTIAIIALGGVLVGLMAATNLVNPAALTIGGTLMKVSAAILLLVFVVKQIAKLDEATLVNGISVMVVFGRFIVGLMAATKLAGPNVNKLGSTILKISFAILLLVFIARIVGSMDPAALTKGAIGVAVFGVLVAGLVGITRLAGGGAIAKVGSTILAISFAMLLMAGTTAILGNMDVGTLAKGTAVITIFSGIISALIFVIGKYGAQVKGIASSIFAISVAIGIMAAVAVLLGLVKIDHLAKGVVAVSLLSIMMTMMIKALKGAQNVKGALIIMTVAIAVLAAAVAGLSFIDPVNLAVATGSLSALMGVFTLLIMSAKSLKKTKSIIAPLAMMLGVVIVLAGVIAALSALNVDASLRTTASLALLVLTMTASLVILSAVGKFTKDALLGVLALTAMVVPLLAFVGVLALMQNIRKATANAMVLSALATTMALLLIPLTIIGAFGMAGLPFIGVLALTTMAVPLLAFVGVLALMQNIQNATKNANLLIALTTTMTAILVVLSVIGPLALIGVAALTALSGLMLALGVLATGIGALMEKFPALQGFLDKGIPVLVQLAGGIGQMIGAFVNGILVEISAGLPIIGTNLSLFMTNATAFIMGAKMVDDAVLKGVGILAGAIALLTAADLLESMVAFISGGSSFSTLGTELSLFITNAMPFIMMSKQIDPAVMEGVKALASAILILTGANMFESITRLIGGESSLATFGSQLGDLATNLKTFVTNLGTFTEEQVTTITCAGKAIKALAEAAGTIPNEGGLWAKIVGENSLATFGSYLPDLGTNLKNFATNLGTFGKDSITTVECAGKAIKALAEAAGTIPNEGGLWAKIVGENSLATFGAKLPSLGTNIAAFVTNLGTFGKDSITTVECAGATITSLAKAANTIPNDGGWVSKMLGENSLATFGDKLPGLGEDLAKFVSRLGTFGPEQIATVNSACEAMKSVATLGTINLETTTQGLSKFGTKLKAFAPKLASFCWEIGNIGRDSIIFAINQVNDVISLAQRVNGVNLDSLKTFGTSIKSIAKDGITGFVNEFKSETPKADIEKAAKSMMDAFGKAAEGKKDAVKKKAKTVAEAAVDVLDSKSIISDAKDAGKNVVTGFANGIKNNKSLASDAGGALGKAALKAAKEALDENSPSKEMYKIGDFAGIGFVNALIANVSKAYKAGATMADSAKTGISKSIANITDLINSDIDVQPTIRPVLDLSDVRSGAGSINNLFSGRTLAINMAGVGAVSASMLGYQNGNNSRDIVSGIKALRKDIAGMSNNTYHIDGITYDDGTNISEAVKSLVRAAKVERRI